MLCQHRWLSSARKLGRFCAIGLGVRVTLFLDCINCIFDINVSGHVFRMNIPIC